MNDSEYQKLREEAMRIVSGGDDVFDEIENLCKKTRVKIQEDRASLNRPCRNRSCRNSYCERRS